MMIRAAVIAAALLAAMLPSSASAQTVNGCVKNKNGALRIVADLADCTSREAPISWNETGPQGEPGEPGEPGDPEGLLQQQLDALQSQTDRLPIVVDSAGEALGYAVIAGKASAGVLFDLPGFPLFRLTVLPQAIQAAGVTLWFESEDCSGQAWIDATDARGVLGTVFGVPAEIPPPPERRTFYVADPLDSPETIFRLTWDSNGTGCEPADVGEVSAKRVTPLDLDSMFTPPFRVTTPERM